MTLDEAFGEIVVPARVDALEQLLRPHSLTELNENTAGAIGGLLLAVEQRCAVSTFLTTSTTILWLVDADGKILLAVEEAVSIADHDSRHPLHTHFPLLPDMAKLGHPALVGAAPARIGGEIYFDDGTTPGVWVLTNKSGRYGINLRRKHSHLESVAAVLKRHNLNVDVQMF